MGKYLFVQSFVLMLTMSVFIHSPVFAQAEFNVVEKSIAEIQTALQQGEITSVRLVEQYLARIDAYDKQGPNLNSIIRINPQARDVAAALDAERQRTGVRSLLHGIPILVKDNYNTVDMPTTGGSVALANFVPNANSTQIDMLIDAGAIIIAKTALHEYARGITTIASLSGQTRNPYDIRRVPGGSSGGTGAAVAASFGAIGLGSDTCGSIRIPSAFNNLFGLRPTKGLSSIYGVMPLSHTQDVAGPLARSLDDLAILLDIVVGYDANDTATAVMQNTPHPQFRQNLASLPVQGLRLGKLTRAFENTNGAVLQPIEAALQWYEENGARLIEVEIPELGDLLSSSALISHEFRVDLDQYLVQFGSEEITDLTDIVDNGLYHVGIAQGMARSRQTERDEEVYAAAVARRTDLRKAIERAFLDHELDAIVYPTVVENQVFIGEPQTGSQCQLAAHSGLPALSMPVGINGRGLPVGLELMGLQFQDAQLLAMAFPYEQSQNPRILPSVTPRLENGTAPQPQQVEIYFNREGAALEGSFEVDITTNLLQWDLVLAEANRADVYAVTLIIDEEESIDEDGDEEEQSDGEESLQLNNPIVLNLMGPERESVTGTYFMSSEFRQALIDNRVYLKVFANTLPLTGSTQLLQ